MTYRIDKAVFARFPDFRRAVIVARNVNNQAVSDDLLAKLRQAEERVRHNAELADFRAHPFLATWNAVFKDMGLNPNRFPPSVINLIKRVRSGKELPVVNPLVALFNCISLDHLVPCGGDDLSVVTGDLRLAPAAGNERYVPLGQPDVCETPPPGEIIYYDTGNLDVFCRAWCWKNGDRSKMTSQTRSAVINVDAMAPVDLVHVEKAAHELADMVREHTGGTASIHLLTPANPAFNLEG